MSIDWKLNQNHQNVFTINQSWRPSFPSSIRCFGSICRQRRIKSQHSVQKEERCLIITWTSHLISLIDSQAFFMKPLGSDLRSKIKISPFDKPALVQFLSLILCRCRLFGNLQKSIANMRIPSDHTVPGSPWYWPVIRYSGGQYSLVPGRQRFWFH